MKYFTKEYQKQTLSTLLDLGLKIDPRAEVFSQSFFQECWQNWESFELAAPDACFLYTMQQAGQQPTRENHLRYLRSLFPALVKYLAARLPPDILRQVADIRVLQLGYASAPVRQAIVAFCESQQALVRQAHETYDEAFRKSFQKAFYPEIPPFARKMCRNSTVLSCRKKGADLLLDLDDSGDFGTASHFVFRNYQILEQEKKLYGAIWQDEELYRTPQGCELHVLFQSRTGHFYFTVRAAEIVYKCEEKPVKPAESPYWDKYWEQYGDLDFSKA